MVIKNKTQFAKALGKRIREFRMSKGISLKHFESLDGAIDRHDLSKIEQGQKVPNTYTVYKICRCLGVSIDELLKGI